MWTIKQPSKIIFGKNSANKFTFPTKCLVISSKGARTRGWLDYVGLNDHLIYDKVESNPSIETTEKIISKFQKDDFTHIVGIGGGSSMDVAKYCAFKMNKLKIMIPTTFGSGSEVTRISVLKIDGEKKSFHDDNLFADISIIDSFFIYDSPIEIIKNSAIDALAQCSEGFDSKNGNYYTKFLCNYAFELLEEGVMNMDQEKIVKGSLASGLGFGNCSTTLGHALSYVFSNEGYSHGHALSHTTLLAHEFNKSKYYERFKKIVEKLKFSRIKLEQNYVEASELILSDRKHLDNNPLEITKNDIISLLKKIND